MTVSIRVRLRALLREPLVHFALAGLAAFVLLPDQLGDPGDRRIVIDEVMVSRLADRFVQSYRRAPSPEELDGLIRDAVLDEAYYREALRLGLDKDDEVVRRRMRNKLAATMTADAEARQPSDAELQALIDRDPARYAAETRFSFAQIYLGADNADTRQTAAMSLGQLKGGQSVTAALPAAALPSKFSDATSSEITEQFGDNFVPALAKAQLGEWSGPLASGLGLHLVRIEQRQTTPAPPLAQNRQRVENDWRADAIRKAEAEAARQLLAGYEVKIERPR